MRLVKFYFLMFFVAATLSAQYQTRVNYGAKFEPTGNKILMGAGQKNPSDYVGFAEVMGKNLYPDFYMHYCGLSNSSDYLALELEPLDRLVEYLPDTVGIQLGLGFTGSDGTYGPKAAAVAQGKFDADLTALAAKFNTYNRRVFVCIGYECNGTWNCYNATDYVAAFRYIDNFFRSRVPKYASVWCTHPVDNMTKINTYYPGDSYVDWWSTDIFEAKWFTHANTTAFLAAAVTHGKPVMIGESTPVDATGTGAARWSSWYNGYFNMIKNNPVIKAVSYINSQWKYTSNPTWGDARIEKDAVVACNFRTEMKNSIYKTINPSNTQYIKTINAVSDSYVRNGSYASTVYKSATSNLIMNRPNGDNAITYIKFDLSNITSQVGTVSNATLFLDYQTDTWDPTTVDIYSVETNWDENTLTWNNKPAFGTLLTGAGNNVLTDMWVRITKMTNIGTYLKAAILAGKQFVGFAITNYVTPYPANTDQLEINSLEVTDALKPSIALLHSGETLLCGCEDTTPPTAPTAVNASSLTGTSFTLNWTAATDFVAVTGYDVFKDGSPIGSTTGATSLAISGLTPETTYSMTVKAKDAAANISPASSPISVNTSLSDVYQLILRDVNVIVVDKQIITKLSSIQRISSVSIIDGHGTIINSIQTADKQIITCVPIPGIYLVRVVNESKVFTQKVMVK